MPGFVDTLLGRGRDPSQFGSGGIGEQLGNFLRMSLGGTPAVELARRRQQRDLEKQELDRVNRARSLISQGNLAEAARIAPELASQAAQAQSAVEDPMRSAGLRAANAINALIQRGVDPQEAFRQVASLPGGERILAPQEELFRQGGPGALQAFFGGSQESTDLSERYVPVGRSIFDRQEQRFLTPEESPDATELARIDLLRAQAEAARARAQAAPGGRPQQQPQTEAQKEFDRRVAREVADWTTGGRATTAANLARLDDAVNQLRTNPRITGPIAGIGTVNVRQITNPRSAAMQQQVQNAIQASLKETLGGAFARVEGEQLLDRAFAPRMQEEENIRRIQIVADMTREAAAAKDALAQYINENGTAIGYQGPTTEEMADRLIATLRQFAGDSGGARQPEEAQNEPFPGFSLLSPEEQEEARRLLEGQ